MNSIVANKKNDDLKKQILLLFHTVLLPKKENPYFAEEVSGLDKAGQLALM